MVRGMRTQDRGTPMKSSREDNYMKIRIGRESHTDDSGGTTVSQLDDVRDDYFGAISMTIMGACRRTLALVVLAATALRRAASKASPGAGLGS